MARIAAGTVTLHDARTRTRRNVTLESFEIGVYPVTEDVFAELLGIVGRHPERPVTAPTSRSSAGISKWTGCGNRSCWTRSRS